MSLCKYCLGCVAEEQDSFNEKMNCKGFVPAYDNWQEKFISEMKENK